MGYPREFLDELRSRVGLVELIGRRVKLVRCGREYAGLCPFHHEKTGSFYVAEGKRFWHCFGCAAHGDAIGFVMRADGLDFGAAVEQLAGEVGLALPDRRARSQANNPPAYDSDVPMTWAALRDREERNRPTARKLWNNARDPRGTLVEKYLCSRRLRLPPAPVLRFAPRCWNREMGDDRLPAMLARVDDANGNFIAVHRTWLRPDGSGKAALRDQKLSLAPTGGGAIRLAPAGSVLAVSEGIENALTAIRFGFAAWSAVSSGGMTGVVLPPIVSRVLILADHDANGVGQRAAERWLEEGRTVELVMPPRPGDLNDVLMQ